MGLYARMFDYSFRDKDDPRHGEFLRLKARPRVVVAAGDRVLVASGLLGRGFLWEYQEATVTGCNADAVQVDFGRSKIPGLDLESMDLAWIHPALIIERLYRPADVMQGIDPKASNLED